MNIQPPDLGDSIDTGFVFKAYAVLAWAAGAVLFVWGNQWFSPGTASGPFAVSIPTRVVGGGVIAAGMFAYATAQVDDPVSRRRALAWWGLGHFVVLASVVSRAFPVLPGMDVAINVAILALLTATILFVHFWFTAEGMGIQGFRPSSVPFPMHTSIFGGAGSPPIQHLRSAYEEEIRAAASQEERNRLARDLHDSIKQQIFVIQTAAATAQARFGQDASGAAQAIEQVRSSAREAMQEMEVMLDQLRSSPLENTSLVDALKRQCEALQFRTGADVQFGLGELPPARLLPPGTHQALFRVAQEALANIGRHARATMVGVRLDSGDQRLTLEIDDDGVGFDLEQPSRGMGLENMRARLAPFGGTVIITSRPGTGTSIRASVPCLEDEYADLNYYRRRVYLFGALLVSQVLFGVVQITRIFRHSPSWASQRDSLVGIWQLAIVIWFLAMFVRVVLKYRRIKRQGEQA
jgi:signal transduction histidine kinase